jgi:hypothetical protein
VLLAFSRILAAFNNRFSNSIARAFNSMAALSASFPRDEPKPASSPPTPRSVPHLRFG